jgi:hypothetical protein
MLFATTVGSDPLRVSRQRNFKTEELISNIIGTRFNTNIWQVNSISACISLRKFLFYIQLKIKQKIFSEHTNCKTESYKLRIIIAVPTGIKIFRWLATIYGTRITYRAACLWALGFLVLLMCQEINYCLLQHKFVYRLLTGVSTLQLCIQQTNIVASE